jgi:hypothetical protein
VPLARGYWRPALWASESRAIRPGPTSSLTAHQLRYILSHRFTEVLLFGFFKKPASATPKPSLDDVAIDIESIPGAVQVVGGCPRIEWSKVQHAASAYAQHPALGQIWTELAAQWLTIVGRHLGNRYQVYEAKHLLLLSAQAAGPAQRLLAPGDAAYERLEALLQRTPESRGFGKHAVLLFDSHAAYYDYISYFYPDDDREYATSAGIHISRGYRHTAIDGTSHGAPTTLVHELAHDLVFDRPLPAWVNEGLAQLVEDMVPGYERPPVDARQVRLHYRYWSRFGMDHFWSGEAFERPSSQRLSYQLADILFRNLAAHPVRRRQLPKFLATAHGRDAGAAACKECFGCSLSGLVKEFLGPRK